MARQTAELREQGPGSSWVRVALAAATVALVGGVVLWQLRPTGDAVMPTTVNHHQVREPASRSHEEPQAQRSDAEMYSQVQASTATTPERGGMAELYHEQRIAAGQHNAHVACGDGVQPALCY